MDLARLAKAVHGDIAAQTEYHGEIGQEAGTCLGVYLIEKLSGITYKMGNSSIKMNPEQAWKQLRMVEDFARNVDVKVFHVDYYQRAQRSAPTFRTISLD